MSINFPSNPTTGDIFVFNQKKWRWNGYAWDRHPVSPLAAQTGILYGGELSATIGGSTFSVAAGIGQIVGYTANEYGVFPTLTEITWGDFTGATLNYLATNDFTRVYIDSNGDLQQQTAEFNHTDPNTKIIIGTISHIDQSTIALVTNKQHTAYNDFHKLFELYETFGPIKKLGMNVSANGANLRLNVSSGEALVIGGNYPTDFIEPDTVDYSAQTPAVIARIYRDGSGDFTYDTNSLTFYTDIDPGLYDDNSGTLQTVNNNQWTVQRLYVFPNLQNVVMSYYGRVIYNSYSDALSGVVDEVFTESDITANNAVFLGYLVLRGGAADLSTTSDAKLIQSGFCRVSGGGGGGGGSTSVYYAGAGLTLDVGGETFSIDPTAVIEVSGISLDAGGITFADGTFQSTAAGGGAASGATYSVAFIIDGSGVPITVGHKVDALRQIPVTSTLTKSEIYSQEGVPPSGTSVGINLVWVSNLEQAVSGVTGSATAINLSGTSNQLNLNPTLGVSNYYHTGTPTTPPSVTGGNWVYPVVTSNGSSLTKLQIFMSFYPS